MLNHKCHSRWQFPSINIPNSVSQFVYHLVLKLELNQGYLVGNPVTDLDDDKNERIPYAHGMGLIPNEYYEVMYFILTLSIIHNRSTLFNSRESLNTRDLIKNWCFSSQNAVVLRNMSIPIQITCSVFVLLNWSIL